MVMQEYEYVYGDDIHQSLMDQLQNQPLTDEQLKSIQDAPNFREKIISILKTVHDPEIPVSIWELGLIYMLDIKENHDIHIQMTLTAPTCPIADAIPAEVTKRIKEHAPEHGDINVELVWEPQWTKDRMSDEAKLTLDMW